MMIETIKTKLAAYKPVLTERYGVKEIGIFGSYVRGELTLAWGELTCRKASGFTTFYPTYKLQKDERMAEDVMK